MSRWQRHPTTLWRRSSDRVLLLPRHRHDLLLLEGIGAAVWLLLDEPATVEQLAEVLPCAPVAPDRDVGNGHLDTSPAAARAVEELHAFLSELVEAGAVCTLDGEVAR